MPCPVLYVTCCQVSILQYRFVCDVIKQQCLFTSGPLTIEFSQSRFYSSESSTNMVVTLILGRGTSSTDITITVILFEQSAEGKYVSITTAM